MESMHPIIKRGRDVWDKINLPKSEFQERVIQIIQEIKKGGMDVLLVYGNGPENYGNPCYISNFLTKLPKGTLAVVHPDGRTALFFEGSSRDTPAVKETTWVKQVKSCNEISTACVNYLKDNNLLASTIGIAGFNQMTPFSQSQSFAEATRQSRIVNFDDKFTVMRMIKSPNEQNQVRRASRVLNQALSLAGNSLQGALNERTFEAIVDRVVRLEGAEDFRMMVAKPGENKWAFRPTRNAELSEGESIMVYTAVEFERYWSEAARTFTARTISSPPGLENLKPIYETVVKMIRPGVKSNDLYDGIFAEIEKNKLDLVLDYGLGHGIGLNLHEAPFINPTDTTELKEGMSLALHLLVKDGQSGAVILGNTILLAAEGSEVLTAEGIPVLTRDGKEE